MTLGEKIYSLRIKNGLSQEAFGEKLSVSRQSVSKWETDQSVPELDKIVLISNLFMVSTDYLLKEGVKDEAAAIEKRNLDVGQESVRRKESLHVEQGTSGAEQEVYGEELHAVIKHRVFYEYKSKKSWQGLPLIHVNIGFGRSAKGVIAIGLAAKGIVAVGLAGLGVITLAPVGIGLLLSIGVIAVGGIALGNFAIGIVALGAVCVGLFSMGALAVGQFSFGAMAIGQQVAVGDVARGNIALGFSDASGTIFQQITGKQTSFDPQDILQAIDENVSSSWYLFKQWSKAMIHMIAGA